MGLLIHDEGSTTAGFISEYKVLATADHKPLESTDLRPASSVYSAAEGSKLMVPKWFFNVQKWDA